MPCSVSYDTPHPPPHYDLVDVDEWTRDGKLRHHIPPMAWRCGLRVGAFALLIFQLAGDGVRPLERIYVKVTEGDATHEYVGAVVGRPAVILGLKFGDVVRFEPRHILSFEQAREHGEES